MGKINLNNVRHVHFIGIGGISMSGLAEILYKDGFTVTGSDDRTSTPTIDHLRSVGIDITAIGSNAQHLAKADLVVYTAAIKDDNPELSGARSMGIPTMVRAELLGEILKGYEYAVCVAGTHGKTSTTGMITGITLAAGLDPTVNIGGYVGGTNYHVGQSPYFILEACEYSNSFHHWHPYIGVILNIDADHMDFYSSMDAIIESFAKFAHNIRPSGTLIIQEGIPGFDKITEGLECEVITFNGNNSRYRAKNITANQDSTQSFDITEAHNINVRINLPLPGTYNIENALAAYAVARVLGVEPEIIVRALANTQGVKRRYEHKGNFNGTNIIDDYAHHPTEIVACLAAARSAHPGRIICLFQSHTYTRTKTFFEDFANSFADADMTVFVPIFAAREPFDPTISAKQLSERVEQLGKPSINCESLEEAEAFLRGKLLPDDLLITMGAGDVYLVGERLLGL